MKSMIFGYIFYNLSPSYLFLFIYYYFKIKKYVITGDKEVTNSIMKQITNEIYYTEVTYSNGKNQPSGFFIGKKYYGFIDTKDGTIITMYTKESTYNSLIEQDIKEEKEMEKVEPKRKNKINVYIRKGTYRNLYYSYIRLDLSHIQPIGQQQNVIDSMNSKHS